MKHKIKLLLPLALGLVLPSCSLFEAALRNPHSGDDYHVVVATTEDESEHKRTYPAVDQTPLFECFSEIAYYAPYINEGNDALIKTKQMLLGDILESAAKASSAADSSQSSIARSSGEYSEESNKYEDYQDEQGRYHYRIIPQPTFTFSGFVYFDFTSEGCDFLENNIGNGLIHGLMVETEFFSEKMIVLKNEDRYFSCFLNGFTEGGLSFSAHKFLEGFDLIKDLDLKYSIEVASNRESGNPLTITFGNQKTFNVDQESIARDGSITVSVNELRAHFGLEPDPRFE